MSFGMIKPKYSKKTECYMDTVSKNLYQSSCIKQDFNTSNYKVENQLLIESNKKVIVLIKYEFGWKITTKFRS